VVGRWMIVSCEALRNETMLPYQVSAEIATLSLWPTRSFVLVRVNGYASCPRTETRVRTVLSSVTPVV
jgi:hypothetical protein